MAIDPRSVQKKSEEFLESKGLPKMSLLGNLFLESNTTASFVNGAMTATTVALIFFKGLLWPFFVWLLIMIVHSIIKAAYWLSKIRIADRELARLDKEMAQLNEEIKRKQMHFEGIRKKKGIS